MFAAGATAGPGVEGVDGPLEQAERSGYPAVPQALTELGHDLPRDVNLRLAVDASSPNAAAELSVIARARLGRRELYIDLPGFTAWQVSRAGGP